MQNIKNDEFMMVAIEQAKLAQQAGDFPFGSVIVCNGKIVGKGKCENNSTGDVTDHAELCALRDACKNLDRNHLEDCTLYTTNEPCPMCASGIFQSKIPKVIVGLTRDDLPHFLRPRKIRIQQIAEDSGYPIEIINGVMKSEILKLFDGVERK
jgi:tRNA(Arg) A34 adenosine deaminase TadA